MENFEKRISKFESAIPKYAKAKAERVYLEQYRKSLKAILMAESGAKTAVEREQYAYKHERYLEMLKGIKQATEIEEKCKWALEKFKVEFEHWRTLQANERFVKDRV